MTKTAIILAAGLGSRLGQLTARAPKCLLPVGPRGESLLDRMLDDLVAAGIEDVALVVGHHSEVLVNHVRTSPHFQFVRFVLAENYRTHNNCYSLLCGMTAIEGSFLVINSDVAVECSVVARVMAASGSVLAVDTSTDADDEAMKVRGDERGHVESLGKGLATMDAIGEYIGVARIAATDASTVSETARALLEGGRVDAYYEDAFANAIASGALSMAVLEVDEPWVEVDTELDLQRARSLFGTQT